LCRQHQTTGHHSTWESQRLDGPHSRAERCGEIKIFTLPEIDPQFGGHPTHTKTERGKYKLQLFEIKVLGKTLGSKKNEIGMG
jgi:hypothetical protein